MNIGTCKTLYKRKNNIIVNDNILVETLLDLKHTKLMYHRYNTVKIIKSIKDTLAIIIFIMSPIDLLDIFLSLILHISFQFFYSIKYQ